MKRVASRILVGVAETLEMTSMERRVRGLCLAGLLLLTVGACGRVPDNSGVASGVRTSPTPPITSPPPSPSGVWQVYTDAQFGFSISYPADFTFKQEGGADPTNGWLIEYRAVDTRFLNAYPPGQVEMGIYKKDADTPTAWVQKHTGPCFSPNSKAFYWDKATNLMSVTAAGRDAVSFDWNMSSCGPSVVVHETVFFLGAAYVVRFDWYTADVSYTANVQPIAQQMLGSFGAKS